MNDRVSLGDDNNSDDDGNGNDGDNDLTSRLARDNRGLGIEEGLSLFTFRRFVSTDKTIFV